MYIQLLKLCLKIFINFQLAYYMRPFIKIDRRNKLELILPHMIKNDWNQAYNKRKQWFPSIFFQFSQFSNWGVYIQKDWGIIFTFSSFLTSYNNGSWSIMVKLELVNRELVKLCKMHKCNTEFFILCLVWKRY